jgi:hypothetical protein
MEDPDKSNKNEFLTTLDKWDLPSLVQITECETWVACLILIRGRGSGNSLLEMKGQWIKKIWNIVLTEMPFVLGHRLAWSELLFLTPMPYQEILLPKFSQILQSLSMPELESRCLFELIEGDIEAKLMIISKMGMCIGKWHQLGYQTSFKNRLLNGESIDGNNLVKYP